MMQLLTNRRALGCLVSNLVLLFVCASTQAATLIFSDDFESGNLNKWTGNVSAANSASQEQVFGGSWADKYDSSKNTNGGMYIEFSDEQQIYVKFYWYPVQTFGSGPGSHF